METNFSQNGADQAGDMEIRLWDYIDGISSEATTVEKLIAENGEWRAKYNELLDLQSLVQSVELEEPSLRFTRNVMEEIARTQIAPAAKTYINNKIIWGIASFFLTVILGFLMYGLSQLDWSSGAGDTHSLDFTRVDYNKMFNNTFVNLFMMLNVVLGLMLLDHYLGAKRKRFIENQRR